MTQQLIDGAEEPEIEEDMQFLANKKFSLSLVAVATTALPIFFKSTIGSVHSGALFTWSMAFTIFSAGMFLVELGAHLWLSDHWEEQLWRLRLQMRTLGVLDTPTSTNLANELQKKTKIRPVFVFFVAYCEGGPMADFVFFL